MQENKFTVVGQITWHSKKKVEFVLDEN